MSHYELACHARNRPVLLGENRPGGVLFRHGGSLVVTMVVSIPVVMVIHDDLDDDWE